MKRIFWFLVTNLAVLLVLTAAVQLFGLDRFLGPAGGLGGLLVFAAVFGFGGALVSLALSKWMAKRAMGVRVIEHPANAAEQWLVETVGGLAQRAGVAMPEVGIFDAPEPNAFATGATRDRALVAVSTGLLRRLNRPEVEAVLGHEISHVANGDMVTLALIQGVVNTFVIFLARIVGNTVDRLVLRSEDGRGIGYFLTVIAAELVLGVLASVIVMAFSRRREFRADAGGARLAGRNNMVAALEALKRQPVSRELPQNLAAFAITGGTPAGWRRLFMSHPPLDERIAALRSLSEPG